MGNDAEKETFCFNESVKTKATPPPSQLATPGERGKEWTEYPGESGISTPSLVSRRAQPGLS